MNGAGAAHFKASDLAVTDEVTGSTSVSSPEPLPVEFLGGVPDFPAFANGLAHYPLGDVSSLTVNGRRLSACCLGSSGEDGVEVLFSSAFGGGVAVEVGPLLDTPGAALRHKHKGWDGVIYGNHRLDSNGDGTGTFTFDFSGLGATSVQLIEYAEDGTVLSDEVHGGPIVAKEWVPNFTCPGGGTPIKVSGWRRVCPTCLWFWWEGWICDNGGTYTVENARIVVIPTLPGGVPSPEGLDSISVTASGVAELSISQEHLAAFNQQCWGLGGAQLSEQCDSGGGCAADEYTLHLDNLGSTGEDGVGIDLNPNSGGVSTQVVRGNCCRGHVIIMKLYDDAGQEQRVSRTQIDELAPLEEVDADFSSMGATGFRLTLYDAFGEVLGPPTGTEFLNGGPKPVFTGLCQPGQTEWWINTGTSSNPVWSFQGCIGGYDFVLPGYGQVSGVTSYDIEPLGATSSVGRLTRCDILSTDTNGFVIQDVEVSTVAGSDLNVDGVVDLADLGVLADCMAGPGTSSPPAGCDAGQFSHADIDGDDDADLADFAKFQRAYAGG